MSDSSIEVQDSYNQVGQQVVVIGGGMIGYEAAELLAMNGGLLPDLLSRGSECDWQYQDQRRYQIVSKLNTLVS